jgi:hypothetical protein
MKQSSFSNKYKSNKNFKDRFTYENVRSFVEKSGSKLEFTGHFAALAFSHSVSVRRHYFAKSSVRIAGRHSKVKHCLFSAVASRIAALL